ncbi:hypothetical protein CLOP_g18661 [Closterium sp. NIES-67]|nr:hypothetical protein CLOP_g18661 [Closterium sp. NIES-67]
MREEEMLMGEELYLKRQQDQWTPEWLRQQILQEDFRRRHVGGGASTKTAEGYGAAGRGRGRGGWRGRGRGRSFGRGSGRGDYNEGHGSSSGKGSTRMEGTCWYCKKQNGVAERFNRTLQEGARTLLGRAGLPDPFWVSALRQVALVKNRVLATDHKGWLLWDLTIQKLTVSRDVKFLESLYYKEWKQQQQKLPSTPLIVEADELQQPSRQVEVAVSEEEMSGVTEEGGAAEWKASEDEEFGSLIENETWDLCDLPPGKKAITSKMIYRHKYGPEGELTRYKSRLVARGFQQTKGKDYDEVFAPVGKGTTLRVLLAIAALLGWKIRQMDIVTAFLNGIIMEEVYMKQPEGLDDGSGRVCRLKKAIYGLKQAPRAWYHKLEEALLAGGFKKSECDPSLFLLQEKDEILMLLVYVDDILLFSASTALLDSAEQMLEMQFKCSKMGEA